MDPADPPPPPPPANPASPDAAGDDPARTRSFATTIGRQLGGDLPCIICRYNLKGLSIRAVCPECGAAVRATILSVVDPQANVLQPIDHPRLVAGGLIAWTGGGLLATLALWAPNAWESLGFRTLGPLVLVLAMLGLVMSAVGSMALVRPHAGIPARQVAAAVLAILLYGPLARIVWTIGRRHIDGQGPQYLARWRPTSTDTQLAISGLVILASALLLQRPNARLLVARCILLRSGRVDRQTLLAVAGASLVIALGHGLGRLAETGQDPLAGWGRTLGLSLIICGAGLLLLGLLGSLIDSIRIARAIVRPRKTFRQVVRGGASPAAEGAA